MTARRIIVKGIVQGVGFRPFVYREAVSLKLSGWVKNDSDTVIIEIAGPAASLEIFLNRIRSRHPPAAEIHSVTEEEIPANGIILDNDFTIKESTAAETEVSFIPADLSVCPQCLSEMNDPSDRRHQYPFINCTDCGPRFTVIQKIPYDRKNTVMSAFEMCEDCRSEYTDIKSRRFHAEPIACPVCGPSLLFFSSEQAPLAETWLGSKRNFPSVKKADLYKEAESAGLPRNTDPVDAAAGILKQGKILALKGLGGYQLVCDARSEAAVSELRKRKNRYRKPLAVMFPDEEILKKYVHLNDAASALLRSHRSPVVILPSVTDADPPLAGSVNPGLKETGVMLPVTPLHFLLLEKFGGPLIMTSANLSEEPICTEDTEALKKLNLIADFYLTHNRVIHTAADDSVIRSGNGADSFIPVRLSRGYSPFLIHLKNSLINSPSVLAAGSDLKNAPALLYKGTILTGPHCGDLANAESFQAFLHSLDKLKNLTGTEPEYTVCDMHPEYVSSKWARSTAGEKSLIRVQHHHAHIVSVLAEHGYQGGVIGMALDGTGYGPDGIINGFEIMHSDDTDYRRIGTMLPVPLPGGAAAVKEPWRTALSMLHESADLLTPAQSGKMLLSWLETLAKYHPLSESVIKLLKSGYRFPLSRGCGRLFDGIAALSGPAGFLSHYEGQTAMELEAVLPKDASSAEKYPFPLLHNPSVSADRHSGFLFRFDYRPLTVAVLSDVFHGIPVTLISLKFHNSLVHALTEAALVSQKLTGENTVALSGGTFQNRYLRQKLKESLESAGFRVLLPVHLPSGDGGLAPGQALAAINRINGKKSCV